ncbi:hypothetical protein PFAG_04314 [Plasmodium falciparum Santa Lucia]|uniref:Uncharacterized protein n=14 Tax=Plasmodium falciparum TaxID=5833 RepID=Q8IEP0_PLAF7|nr:conserved Plasmodium protein, unknown function [Plasmodium falciparum 3D7]ETW17083.1 hypothetical protein PFFVO_03912 [Plasmodium falciparum Vietnam Oak-Knoll (FVO)]ETW29646.1 hypothetical protein PFFCH_02916 [Plasmodium falciparum FCH/4]ETW35028.1 hypothetical protein PFTANZ_04281 [Plasmodium falciparum Tanzania (2000708)]ETW47763.1 hypothetical protein PFMALIP_04162 [Plasmodium falciparum MaliPS096_E11]ETW54822.1 hypothetical protein PFUGPA_03424 [Plasmodium falciparum Palo Alto/Uganda]E|eukprot:XP_001349802.1 conserved Plasmodium protein, unknown function [Plasmodium falciparum 3D7]
MFTLISVCSYLFYTHKESLLNLIGLSENRNSRKNRRRKKKKGKLKQPFPEEKLCLSDSDMRRKKFILRTYSDVNFNVTCTTKKERNSI